MSETMIFALVVYMIIKHFVGDWLLQNEWMATNKGDLKHPAVYIHSAIHALLSVPALIFVGSWVMFPIITEFFAHGFLDWKKSETVNKNNWTVRDYKFWLALGMDQTLHMIWYVYMVSYWILW